MRIMSTIDFKNAQYTLYIIYVELFRFSVTHKEYEKRYSKPTALQLRRQWQT